MLQRTCLVRGVHGRALLGCAMLPSCVASLPPQRLRAGAAAAGTSPGQGWAAGSGSLVKVHAPAAAPRTPSGSAPDSRQPSLLRAEPGAAPARRARSLLLPGQGVRTRPPPLFWVSPAAPGTAPRARPCCFQHGRCARPRSAGRPGVRPLVLAGRQVRTRPFWAGILVKHQRLSRFRGPVLCLGGEPSQALCAHAVLWPNGGRA